MQTHTAPRLARSVSAIGLGTWQLGADWGDVSEADAAAVLDASVESGVTLFDTADVYGDGRSEQVIGAYLASRPELDIFVATKMGRREAQDPANFTLAKFREWTDRSRTNLRVDTLDLVQLHCPPTPVFSTDAVYDALDELVADGTIARYGVSVETVDEALAAIARPGITSVQIILNAFRLKPLERVLPAAAAAGVAVITRVPLAASTRSASTFMAILLSEKPRPLMARSVKRAMGLSQTVASAAVMMTMGNTARMVRRGPKRSMMALEKRNVDSPPSGCPIRTRPNCASDRPIASCRSGMRV